MFYKSSLYLLFICIYVHVAVGQSAFSNQQPSYNLRNPVNNFFDRIHHFKTTLISLLQQKIQRLQEQFAPIRVPAVPPMAPPSLGIPTFPNIQRPPGHWITQTVVVPPPGRPGASLITHTGVTYQAFPLSMSYPGFFHQTWHGVSTFHPGLGVQPVVNPPPFYPGAFPVVPQPQVPQPEEVVPLPQTTPTPPVVQPTVSPPLSQPVIPAPVPPPPTVTPPGVIVQNTSLPGAQNTTTTSQVVQNATLPLVQNATQTVQNVTSTVPQNVTQPNAQNVTSSQAGQNVSSTVVQNGNTTVSMNQTASSDPAPVPVPESSTSTQKGSTQDVAAPTAAGVLPAGSSSSSDFEERTGPRAIC